MSLQVVLRGWLVRLRHRPGLEADLPAAKHNNLELAYYQGSPMRRDPVAPTGHKATGKLAKEREPLLRKGWPRYARDPGLVAGDRYPRARQRTETEDISRTRVRVIVCRCHPWHVKTPPPRD